MLLSNKRRQSVTFFVTPTVGEDIGQQQQPHAPRPSTHAHTLTYVQTADGEKRSEKCRPALAHTHIDQI